MSEVTFIIGKQGSGKTEEILSRLAGEYEGGRFRDALLLAPTVRHGDQLRRRLVAKCGVAMGLRVESLSQFSRRLLEGDSGFDSSRRTGVADSAVADELLLRIVRQEVERGGASYFKPIVGTRGLGRLVRAAVFNLASEGVGGSEFRAAARRSGMRSLEAVAAIYSAYLGELSRRGWIHPAALSFEAARAVVEGARLPERVFLDGFQVFRRSELSLLQAVGERTPLVVSMDPSGGERASYDFERLQRIFSEAEVVRVGTSNSNRPPRVFGGESGDEEAQLRDMARLIKRRLLEEPHLRPSDFAVAFRQFAPHLSLARQVFSEYRLPLDPASGEPLKDQPLAAWLRRLLRLGVEGWRLADLTAVLESGFANLRRWNLGTEDVRAFAGHAVAKNSWRGHASLLRAAKDMEDRRAGEGITRALKDLQALLEQPAGSLGGLARRWKRALFDEEPLINPDCVNRADVSSALEEIRGHLDELMRVECALGGGEASLEAFVGRLESRMEAPSVLMREVGGVFLAPIRALGGLRFDSVFVGGLVEGEFPAPRATTSLLNERALESLAQCGLHLPPEPSLSEDELWSSASSRADGSLYLWKTRIDSRGRPASGSYYYDILEPEPINLPETSPQTAASPRELAIACAAGWSAGGRQRPEADGAWPIVRQAVLVEQLRRSYGNAGKYEGVVDAGLVPQLTGEEAVWSASRLESYRTCAFRFFGRYGLNLNELEEEVVEADAAIRGSVIHEVLEHVLEPIRKRGLPLNPETLQEALDTLRDIGPGVWNDAPARYGFSSAQMWAFDWEDVLDKLERLLTKEAAFSRNLGVDRILGVEMDMKGELPLAPPLKVRALIDRLDVGPDRLVVVDYKTGRDIPKRQALESKRLQLQLYAHLAVGNTGVQEVVTRYAWLNPRSRDWWLDSANETDAAAIEDVVPVADVVRKSVKSGDFRVNPQTHPCPSYCEFRHICRVNEFSRWKWQR